MNLSLFWYVLAGAILGFALSTLWEWLFYRSKRMVVRDARIAELEAALSDYRDRENDPVTMTSYADGAARLETEEPESLVGVSDEPEEFEAQGENADDSALLADDVEPQIDMTETDANSINTASVDVEISEPETISLEENDATQSDIEATEEELDDGA